MKTQQTPSEPLPAFAGSPALAWRCDKCDCKVSGNHIAGQPGSQKQSTCRSCGGPQMFSFREARPKSKKLKAVTQKQTNADLERAIAGTLCRKGISNSMGRKMTCKPTARTKRANLRMFEETLMPDDARHWMGVR